MVYQMAGVHIPTPEQIREMLARKKEAANTIGKQINDAAAKAATLDITIHEKNKELQASRVAIEKLEIENAKLRDRSRVSVGVMRGKLDELIKKHACEPADELLRMCMEQVPVLDREGNQQFDDEGRPLRRYALDPETRSSVLLKLLEFRMPKLRSTETQGQVDVDLKVVIVRFGENVQGEMNTARAIDV